MGGSLENEEIIKFGVPSTYSFVETGTYKGLSTLRASDYFQRVYTIEIYKPYYEEAIQLFEKHNKKNIEAYLGDTLSILPRLASEIKESIWFIDAHISEHGETWNKQVRVPLLLEIDIILKHNPNKGLFVIDDYRLFDTAWDWQDINENSIKNVFKENNREIQNSYIENDRMYIKYT